ncbi:Alpha/beta hydrolase superfamily enzyme, predicted hydrolase [Verrucomicrobia bacterium]|nr:Alpha/beta hydrolase superfamily enzyme, predicted hydrolase [Verrucomicrobiota bacterium]
MTRPTYQISDGFLLRLQYVVAVQPEPEEGVRKSAGFVTKAVTISVDGGRQVSGLLQSAANPQACYVVAHGAGAGMTHPFMADTADGLAERGIDTLRYQFPFIENRQRRPDVPAVAHATVRAAVAEASRQLPGLALFAGGKSFGGRMTSQAQAQSPLPGVRGLVFLGFPLHAPGHPSEERADHLFGVQIPLLFVQGTRDEFADTALLKRVVEKLGKRATLHLFEDADHSFHVPKRTGRTDSDIRAAMFNTMAAWVKAVLGS